MNSERESNGRFANGNIGGPGRPRRAIEREYLAALSDAVTLDDWRDVVQKALTDAKSGDARARDWLARYLCGDKPTALSNLAAKEAAGVTADAEVEKDKEDVERAIAERAGAVLVDMGAFFNASSNDD